MHTPQSIIRKIATSVRRILDLSMDDPRGQCADYTLVLLHYLRLFGFWQAMRVEGRVWTDGRWTEHGVSWRKNGHEQDHTWCMVGDIVVDISADQFNVLMRPQSKKFPKVYVQPIETAFRHIPEVGMMDPGVLSGRLRYWSEEDLQWAREHMHTEGL